MILAGDSGGTNTRLALFEGQGAFQIVAEEKYPSKQFKSLEEIAAVFLEKHKKPVRAACFGIAGPIRNGRCTATNLPWIVDVKELGKALKIEQVRLVNDLEANANGLKILKPEELFCLQKGQDVKANRAMISAGTGLGEAGLYWDGKEHRPFACEGGHADFAPRNELEVNLLSFLLKKYGHASWERVVSGGGIVEIYEFLTKGKAAEKLDTVAICQSTDPVCRQTVELFLSLYGAEAGNVALKFLALGGVYIGGGIAPKLLDRMKTSGFVRAFSWKGRMKEMLEAIPLYVVLNEKTALLGAASFGREL